MASAVGPAVASIVISNLGNQTALFFDGAIAAISLVIALFIGEESKSTVQKPTAGSRRKSGFFEPSALVPAIYQGLSLFLISCMMCFMTLYIVSRGLSSHVAGSFFVVVSVAIVGVRLCFSKWMNRFAAVVFLIPGYLLLFLVCILLPYAKSSIMFLVCGLVYGMAHGTIWMTLGSEAVRFAPAKRRGASNATFYFAFDAAIGIGAAFWGAIIDKIGYVRCFYLIAIGSLLLMLGAIPTFRRRSTKYQTIIQQ